MDATQRYRYKGYIDEDDYVFASSRLIPRAGANTDRNSSGALRGSSSQQRATAPKRSKAELQTLFKHYDVNHDGFISLEDLRSAMKADGYTLQTAELQQWIQKRDTTGAGRVDFEDFCKSPK